MKTARQAAHERCARRDWCGFEAVENPTAFHSDECDEVTAAIEAEAAEQFEFHHKKRDDLRAALASSREALEEIAVEWRTSLGKCKWCGGWDADRTTKTGTHHGNCPTIVARRALAALPSPSIPDGDKVKCVNCGLASPATTKGTPDGR